MLSGLYLNPPDKSLVLCADEKSQIQALDRTQPGLPMKKGRLGTRTHDYKRNGTTTLFAALSMLDGKVIGDYMARHRHQEFIRFLKKIDGETHSNVQLMVEPCRAVVPRDYRQAHSPRELRERPRSHPGHYRLPRKPQPEPESLCLERSGRTHHGEDRQM